MADPTLALRAPSARAAAKVPRWATWLLVVGSLFSTGCGGSDDPSASKEDPSDGGARADASDSPPDSGAGGASGGEGGAVDAGGNGGAGGNGDAGGNGGAAGTTPYEERQKVVDNINYQCATKTTGKTQSFELSYGQAGSQACAPIPIYRTLIGFRPVDNVVRPGVIVIHGGGWSGGDKGPFSWIAERLAQNGYVGLSVNYQLTSTNGVHYPEIESDLKCILQWIKDVGASQYGIDPQRLGTTGNSAGGHLSLILGLSLNGYYGTKILASHASVPPSDLKRLYDEGSPKSALSDLTGGTPDQVPEMYKQASPVSYPDPTDPPVFAIFGEVDKTVNKPQEGYLRQALLTGEVAHRIILYPNQGHNVFMANPEQNLQEMICFLNEFLM